MSALRKLTQVQTTESKLVRMQELRDQIKILSAEKDMLEDEVRADYFDKPCKYMTSKGVVLAELIEAIGERFEGAKFKKDHPELHASYSKVSVSTRFLLK